MEELNHRTRTNPAVTILIIVRTQILSLILKWDFPLYFGQNHRIDQENRHIRSISSRCDGIKCPPNGIRIRLTALDDDLQNKELKCKKESTNERNN